MTAWSIYQTFEEIANTASNKTALVYLGEKFTFSDLKELVEKLAIGLYVLGIEEGSRVVLYMPHCPQWVIAWLALLKIGALPVPLTPIYTSRDLEYIVNDCGAEAIFCADTNLGYAIRVFSESTLKRLIVTNIAELLPWWKRVLGRAFDKIPHGKVLSSQGILSFGRLLKQQYVGLPRLRAGSKESDEIVEILYTGGTTGFPKGVPIPNKLFMQVAHETRKAYESLIPPGKAVVIQGAPLYHIFGQGLGLGALLQGDTLILLPRMNLDTLLDHIQRYRVNVLFGVPALYRMILEHDRLNCYDLTSLMYCLSAGDVLPLEIAERWYKKFGKPIYQAYGATETGGGVAIIPAGDAFPPGTCGKIMSFQKVKVVDPDSLKEVPIGEPGELIVSSENMVKGYWKKPEETSKCFIEIDGRLWYRTGDIVRIDDQGWLFFEDRSVDIIKHKGYRVAASKIEAVLQEHPAVMAACVVGVPDVKVGERIKAFVVLKEDVRGISAYELINWCHNKLARYEVPNYIEFRDALPKSKVGKLLRREMRDEERRKLEKLK